MPLDEIGLQNQRLFLGAGNDGLKIVYFID